MRSFVTGSRMYGTPREDSDIDLVILVARHEMNMLKNHCDENLSLDLGDKYGPQSASLKFGKLNLIVTTDEAVFAAWSVGTRILCNRMGTIGPANRDIAVSTFKFLFGSIHPYDASEVSTTQLAAASVSPTEGRQNDGEQP